MREKLSHLSEGETAIRLSLIVFDIGLFFIVRHWIE